MSRSERSAGFVLYRLDGSTQPARRLYLVLDYGRHWDFPKGKVEKKDASELETAHRELREETGISGAEVAPGFAHEIRYFFRDRKGRLVKKSVVFYLARTSSSLVRLSDEHVGYAYLPFEQAVERVTFANAKQLLRLAEQHAAGQSS